ncbi:hypothetical protein Sjap_002928 [Stephania japonica]|uniref:Wax synthase domain-containing protein n=1 Tax=Stephania japonica TaxID=461633 RepID=A0AAP0KPA9_9MAGN
MLSNSSSWLSYSDSKVTDHISITTSSWPPTAYSFTLTWSFYWPCPPLLIKRCSGLRLSRISYVLYMGKRWGLACARVATFVVSGLVHELMYYYMTRVKPTCEVSQFFVVHGMCTAVEVLVKKSQLGDKLILNRVVSRVLTIGFVMSTSFWLFFPQLVRSGVDLRVIDELNWSSPHSAIVLCPVVASAPLRRRRLHSALLRFIPPSSPLLRHRCLYSSIIVSAPFWSSIVASALVCSAIITSASLCSAIDVASAPAKARHPCSALPLLPSPLRSFSSHRHLLRPPVFLDLVFV